MTVLTPAQCLQARALLGWSRDRLAPLAGVSAHYLGRFENERTELDAEATAALRSALEAAGVEFIAKSRGGAGVRLRKISPLD